MEEPERDLDWEQKPHAELLRLAWPIALSTVSYSVMTLVDTLLVSHLGAGALGGVGLGGTLTFGILCFFIGTLRGVKTLVSQAVGAKQYQEIGAYLGAGISFALLFGMIAILIGHFMAGALSLFATAPSVSENARIYLQIRILGAPAMFLYIAFRESRYGEGDVRTPMVATLIANLSNILLSYWFIVILEWGVSGAAWSTVIAHMIEVSILLLTQSFSARKCQFASLLHAKELWNVGFPVGIQYTLEVGSFVVLATMLATMGEAQIAAHQIAIQVIHFSFLPAMAIAESSSVLTGQAVGADREKLVLHVAKQSLWMASVYTGFCTIITVLGAPWIAQAFTEETHVVQTTIHLLYVASIFQVFDGANMVARATLRGTGDVRVPAMIGIVSAWLFTPPLTWFLGYQLGLGALGGWIGLCLEIIVGAFILWWRLIHGNWKKAAAQSRKRQRTKVKLAIVV